MAQEAKQNELRKEGKGRIGSINHLRLTVTDIQRAERFYRPLMRFMVKYKSLFQTLGAGALLVLCGCSELRFPLGNLAPPSPTVNTLPKYYRANPAMPEQPKVYGVVDVFYRLVDWRNVASVQNKYSRQGYVPLGQCDFAAQTGVPLQQNAVDFARYLGADLVVYAIQKTADGDTRHYIDFLAKTRKPRGVTADRS